MRTIVSTHDIPVVNTVALGTFTPRSMNGLRTKVGDVCPVYEDGAAKPMAGNVWIQTKESIFDVKLVEGEGLCVTVYALEAE